MRHKKVTPQAVLRKRKNNAEHKKEAKMIIDIKKHRIEKLKKQNYWEGMYAYVFEESLKKPWITDSENDQEKELTKAIIYETLRLVTEWITGEEENETT
jgi:hypothetical protein